METQLGCAVLIVCTTATAPTITAFKLHESIEGKVNKSA